MINLNLNISERVNKIYTNETYKKYLRNISLYEVNRLYCKHNMEHFLDVARIMYIINLENNLNFSKDIIYGCALLHDIGRSLEYTESFEHHIGSSIIARDILPTCDFSNYEIDIICNAIEKHRNQLQIENSLNSLLYISDKLSRNCFSCNETKTCKWDKKKMNLQIKY